MWPALCFLFTVKSLLEISTGYFYHLTQCRMPAYNSTKRTLRKKTDSASRRRAATTASQEQKVKTATILRLKQPRIVNYAVSLLFGERSLLPETHHGVFTLAVRRMDTGRAR